METNVLYQELAAGAELVGRLVGSITSTDWGYEGRRYAGVVGGARPVAPATTGGTEASQSVAACRAV